MEDCLHMANFKLWKGLDLGLKFQYENRAQNMEQYDEADSYYMRELVNKYAETSANGFTITMSRKLVICRRIMHDGHT